MSTVIILHAEPGQPAKPLGTAESAEAAKTWCQQEILVDCPFGHELKWRKYLSRGTGPGTAHEIARHDGDEFQVWTVGELQPDAEGEQES